MSEDPFLQMIALSGTALGLVLVGLTTGLLASRSAPVRLVVGLAAAVLSAAGPAALGFPAQSVLPLTTVGIVAVALRAGWCGPSLAARLRWAGRPLVQGVTLAAAGVALFVGSVAWYETEFEAATDRDTAVLAGDTPWKPPLRTDPAAEARTDAGRPVPLHVAAALRPAAETVAAERRALDSLGVGGHVIRVRPADEGCNCHGWVFTGGRYWLSSDDVEGVLADNGYHPVSDPRPGDVVVYRDRGKVSHSGVVRAATAGGPVLVESKWSWMGVFLHWVDESSYGKTYTFYRSPRDGHLLAGLGGHPDSSHEHAVAGDAATVEVGGVE